MIKRRRNKKGVAMSFNWIFAVMAGGFILFLAVFAAGKFIRTSENTIYTETAASLIGFFDPLETGLASGKAHVIEFKKESRIYFDCDEDLNPPFGSQRIGFSEKTFGDEYGDRGQLVAIKNKYVFTEDVVEGKAMYFFSKPFFMPYKVTDLIMVVSADDNYCFYNSPEYVQEDLQGLNLGNIIFPNASTECIGTNVCFGDSRRSCEIIVYEDLGYVLNKKHGKRVYFAGDLIYGAIFSSPKIYECNVKRIKSKFDQLAGIYLDKINIIGRKDCLSNLGPKLEGLIGPIENSRDIVGVYGIAQDIDSINAQAKSGCQLYYNTEF